MSSWKNRRNYTEIEVKMKKKINWKRLIVEVIKLAIVFFTGEQIGGM